VTVHAIEAPAIRSSPRASGPFPEEKMNWIALSPVRPTTVEATIQVTELAFDFVRKR
jgi:hypothetical protein